MGLREIGASLSTYRLIRYRISERGHLRPEGRTLRVEYFTGLDVGQARDPSALAVVEWAEQTAEWDPAQYAYQKTTSLRCGNSSGWTLGHRTRNWWSGRVGGHARGQWRVRGT